MSLIIFLVLVLISNEEKSNIECISMHWNCFGKNSETEKCKEKWVFKNVFSIIFPGGFDSNYGNVSYTQSPGGFTSPSATQSEKKSVCASFYPIYFLKKVTVKGLKCKHFFFAEVKSSEYRSLYSITTIFS